MRQTRIIATLGPSSATPEGVPALIAAGVDIFRLNFSHGTHEQHAASLRLCATRRPRRPGRSPSSRT